MARRLHVVKLEGGTLSLTANEAHHARNVLRLKTGHAVELFDNAGTTANGTITQCDADAVVVQVIDLRPPAEALQWHVAAAVPKGERADWMVEKLSELGAAAFVPLAAERSVVLPEGVGKRQRWERIAAESAKQSRRQGVMRIEPLTKVDVLIDQAKNAGQVVWYLSTSADAVPISVLPAGKMNDLLMLIGPEGGWAPGELARFAEAGLTGVKLTATILRVETAAIAAAAVVASVLAAREPRESSDPSRGIL